MPKQQPQINTDDKRELVGRFVSDVLKKRTETVIKAKHAVIQHRAKKMCKRNVDLIDKLYAMEADDNNVILEQFGIEVNSWIAGNCYPIKEVPFQPDLHLCNYVDADDMKLNIPTVIKLPYAARVDPDDFQWNLEPNSNDPDYKDWKAIEDQETKLQEDAKTLSSVAYKSIARKTTWAAIETNCPELAPYIDVPADNEPCPAELAEMASCMRVKDDC